METINIDTQGIDVSDPSIAWPRQDWKVKNWIWDLKKNDCTMQSILGRLHVALWKKGVVHQSRGATGLLHS